VTRDFRLQKSRLDSSQSTAKGIPIPTQSAGPALMCRQIKRIKAKAPDIMLQYGVQ
jgi:hypothetical protein